MNRTKVLQRASTIQLLLMRYGFPKNEETAAALRLLARSAEDNRNWSETDIDIELDAAIAATEK